MEKELEKEMDASDYLARKILRSTDIADPAWGADKGDYHSIIAAAVHYLLEEGVILDADYLLYLKECEEKA